MNKSQLLSLYIKCLRIRRMEERIALEYSSGAIRCPIHLSIGQEIVPSLVALIAEDDDVAISTHRCHAHYLAKGGDSKSMIAELYGKKTGCSGGRGGSMHLIDLDVNFYGSTAIVGNSIPIGVGVSLASKFREDKRIVFTYFGDAAVEEGVFYESINFAAVQGLPVIFICENNGFSVYSELASRQPSNRRIHEMVSSIGVEGYEIELNDVDKALTLIDHVVADSRQNREPKFIEFKVPRFYEHCGPNLDDKLDNRNNSAFSGDMKSDVIENLRVRIKDSENEPQLLLDLIEKEIQQEVNLSFQFALKSDYPEPEDWLSSTFRQSERIYG